MTRCPLSRWHNSAYSRSRSVAIRESSSCWLSRYSHHTVQFSSISFRRLLTLYPRHVLLLSYCYKTKRKNEKNTKWLEENHIILKNNKKPSMMSNVNLYSISRVPDQNGVSQIWYIVEIHHSGWKPSIWCKRKEAVPKPEQQQKSVTFSVSTHWSRLKEMKNRSFTDILESSGLSDKAANSKTSKTDWFDLQVAGS